MVNHARRLVALVALVLVAVAAAGFGQPAAAQIPYVNLLFDEPRYAAIVMDANTGEVLYEKHADSQRYPASITKIMTLYLTFEALASGRLSLSDKITISSHAASMPPSKLGLRAGDTITVDDAIRALAVKSANDMAVAMAEKIGGSESRFAALMTLRAQELGMTHTQYVNASGLPDSRQLTTARDIAILSRAVMRDYPQYYGYFGLHRFAYHGLTMSNHNHLLDSMPGVDGLKTGYINASGFNLAASAVRNGRRLIAVVLGGSSTASRDNNVEDLLNTGFEVLTRRDKGENITVAQNLFEPEATGPILRPATEQGDGDQRGLRIILGDGTGAMAPIADPVQPAARRTLEAAPSCRTIRSVKVVRRRGRKVRVATTSRRCDGAAVVQASDPKPCKTVVVRKGPRHKAVRRTVCESPGRRDVAKASHGGWQVQVGAFRRRADAKTQLAKLERRFSDHFADAETSVGAAEGGLYRARFVGLSAEAAHDACSALRAKGETCMAMAMR